MSRQEDQPQAAPYKEGPALRAGTGPLEVGAKTRNATEAREETSSLDEMKENGLREIER